MKNELPADFVKEFGISASDFDDCEKKVDAAREQLMMELNKILLKRQFKRVKQVVAQRYFQSRGNSTVFEMPKVFGKKILKTDELRLLEDLTLRSSEKYLTFALEKKKESWDRIHDKLPDVLKEKLKSETGMYYDDSERLLNELKAKGVEAK